MLYQQGGIFILALLLLAIIRYAAPWIGLMDKPNARKQHHGHIPLVGGIALYLTMLLVTLWQPEWLPHSASYLLCVSILLLLGVLDDRFDLPVTPRVIVQGVITLIMIGSAGMQLNTLGYLWGHDEWRLGDFSLLLTPLAVWGAINAFNMVDGIDGQLAVLSCITLSTLAILFSLNQQGDLALWCLALMASLAAFLLFNLGVFGTAGKIFMGDAGSMVVGFTVLWLLLLATQGEQPAMRPVTVLWTIAIPLMDMVQVMARRLLRRQSPFRAGRDHLHHILMRRGLNSRQALGMSSLLAVSMACVGIISEMLLLPENLMLLAYIFCFLGYFVLLRESCQSPSYAGDPSVDG
ncbi:UDP-N-acetylglucosamine--undecaprenyl-phosphate N-acetylglucosaminephosphotransferase [Serratia sp. D1N4]